ncbi:unnamed protein product [Litomosoides sigmodontis]|uniref:C3H1-type domain-containing protein n=1 Tax=Litomosoides sigmodontis TaxID=42156 RepID=A0A3P7K7P2_LITSI|nr:unnamed protein product [Litomosoides sigmodontis]
MTELKKKGLVGSSSDLANILNKVSTTTAAIATTTVASVPSVSQVTVATTPTYAQLTLPAHSGVAGIPNMSLPPPRFAHGLPMPPVLPTGQYILPVQQQQPLLNGPVPAGVTPTVGVDLTTQSGPSTSEATSYGTYGRPGIKQCTFYQSGTCSYGARCRFAHGDEPTAGTQGYGYSDERGRSFRRGGQSFRGGPRRGGADGVYRRERGGPSFARRGFYDRGRERDRDREREYDYDRRIYDRYGRRRRRSLSRSKSRSRSRSRSLSPFERRPYSPDRRRRGSPHAMNECDQGEHFERRSRGDDRERNDQHVVGVENQLIDAKPRLQNHPTTEGQCSVGGIGCLTGVESVASTDQQKSPPEDPIPSMKPESVQAGSTDSPASPT